MGTTNLHYFNDIIYSKTLHTSHRSLVDSQSKTKQIVNRMRFGHGHIWLHATRHISTSHENRPRSRSNKNSTVRPSSIGFPLLLAAPQCTQYSSHSFPFHDRCISWRYFLQRMDGAKRGDVNTTTAWIGIADAARLLRLASSCLSA